MTLLLLQSGPGAAGGAVVVTYTTWNPSDKSASILLTNGNLSGASSAATDNAVRAVKAVSSGKFYYEVTYNAAVVGVDTGCGIATSAAVLTTVGGNAGNAALAYFSGGGAIWYNAGAVSGKQLGGFPNAGDIVGVAVDMDNKRVWFRRNALSWNNIGTDNPATTTGGVDISAVFAASSAYPIMTINNTNPTLTANFGSSAFAQAVPSGFTAGWPV